MPMIRLHIPDADLELITWAAETKGWSVSRMILEAAEEKALKMKRQRKLIGTVK